MEKRFKGNRYRYIVRLSYGNLFEIFAVRKIDGIRSGIVNLNMILSEVVSHIVDPYTIENTSLVANDSEVGIKLFNRAIDFFNDIDFINDYLENQLDENYDYWKTD